MIEIFWVTDSGGLETAHVNGPSLSYKESYLGKLYKREGAWYYQLCLDGVVTEDSPAYESYARCRADMVRKILEKK